MNREDAVYTIKEIEFLDYYSRRVEKLKKQIDILRQQIDTATSPTSPQGYENIGAGKSMNFAGKESYLNYKITEKDKLTREYQKFRDKFIDAQVLYLLIVDQTDEKDFVKDYFSKKYTKQQLESMYHTTKAYRKLVQVVMNAI